ncbi:MAG: DUF5787 family protein [Halodesulfurarchaeum sp.]
MREYGFELRLCATLEREGVPGLDGVSRRGILSRQLGTSVERAGARVVDVVFVEAGPGFEDRVDLSPETIPPAAIESDAGVGRFRPITDVIDAPPEHARRIASDAAEAGFFEAERRNGRTVVRQTARYPDWFNRLVGVENKPDLGSPGDLARQIRHDVSLGVLDAVVLATSSYVTRAHRNRLPDGVGVWQVDFDRPDPIEVVREPTVRVPGGAGIEVLDSHPGRTDLLPVGERAIDRQRRRIAERAYGKGWRTYRLPPCSHAANATVAGTAGLPGCHFLDRIVNPADECGTDCPGFDPEEPPAVDLDAERAARTPWEPDPPGRRREQSSIDRFIS